MNYSYNIIKADYLQRTRSYAFLITLAITVYAAYSFVPPPTASYTTLNVVGYKGIYNSAWVGYVSAMMTAIMLSLYGFFLINSGIKKDIDTEVGLIIATTPISNFGYLRGKLLSNYLVLLTIAGITFTVSVLMFFIRSAGYPFIISDFIFPYVLFVLPALFFVSALGIIAEVFLRGRSILQYIAFVFLFGVIMANVNNTRNNALALCVDVFGVRTMTNSIKQKINTQYHENVQQINLGFTFNKPRPFKTFVWNGIEWTGTFIASRLFWFALGFLIVYGASFFFHRFDFKQRVSKRKKVVPILDGDNRVPHQSAGFNKALMPAMVTDYGIFPFIKTELLLLVRKGSKWLWLINGGIWISLLLVPLNIAHAYILPVLLFLQVTRLSELVTKEQANRLHYFTFSSYKPLQRMLPAQILAGILLTLVLALPVMLRYVIALNFYAPLSILGGVVFIVLCSVCLGIISGGKKLFEVLFFLITYAVIEKIPVTDYLGAISPAYWAVFLSLSVVFAVLSFVVRNYQARHL